MGEVQIEVLKNMIKERLGLEVSFGTGCIVYKETIAEPVEGVGHFEPLRHYAEAHILLEPGERGSGLTFATDVSTDVLELNWQRLILTHLEEKQHKGAMAKAKYSEERKGHFGLGIADYCHFTSPIRRLSDLATHRIIRRVLFEGKRADLYSSYARRAAAAATEGEIRAVTAERRIEDLYKVIYMSSQVGRVFDATISSITSFGMFCTLDNTCEGLVPISEMPGVFSFDERNLTLRSSYKTYRIAEKIRVRLEEANITRGKLRFSVETK